MNRVIILIYLVFYTTCVSQAQEKVDSLITILNSQSGKEHLNTLLKIAEHFSYGNNGDTIIYYSKISHKEAIIHNDSTAILKSLFYWGSGLYSAKKFDESLEKVENVYELSKKLNSRKEILQLHYLKARNYQGLKQYDDAINLFKLAKDYSLELLNSELNTVASKYFDAIVRQLTYTYWYANQLNEGIIYLDSCISKETELPNHLHRVYFANIAFLYNMGVDFSKAEFYLLKAAEISNKYNDLDQIYMDQSYLGALYSNIGKFEKAILHY